MLLTSGSQTPRDRSEVDKMRTSYLGREFEPCEKPLFLLSSCGESAWLECLIEKPLCRAIGSPFFPSGSEVELLNIRRRRRTRFRSPSPAFNTPHYFEKTPNIRVNMMTRK